MKDIKPIVAKNIAQLRLDHGLTQIELAEKLHYSDKAVSKWERAESMPDISVLVEIADLFEVPLDDLVRTSRPKPKQAALQPPRYNRSMISGISILLVWLVALLVFLTLTVCTDLTFGWLSFIYALPITAIVWLVLNSIWFCPRRNYLIISLLMWSMLAAIHLTLLAAGRSFWILYLPGVPGQAIILLWSRIRNPKNK